MQTEKNSNLRIAGMINESITDGPGFRLVIFMQGCPHHCEGCHNPETWPLEGGTEISTDELKKKVMNNPLLGGVTFSGGEPMLWAKQLLPFAAFLKEKHIDLAIYTGYTFEQLLQNPDHKALLSYASVLIDGKFERTKKSLALKFKGSTNQRIIDVPKSLLHGKVILEESDRWN